ncbi:MAG: hypothetical protein LUE27_09865 [Clostridia bacterium]|nr:hypothetical protein [Clostridia bacterium]
MKATDDNPQVIEGDWFTIDLDGMEMTVSFKPNDTGKERTIIIGTDAGDGVSTTRGYNFNFIQAAQEEAESEDSVDTEDTGE